MVDNFVLIDQQGVFHELYNYSDQKGIVLISQKNECPINRQMAAYVNHLKGLYAPKGITFLMINANLQDDRASIVKEAENYGIQIPILEDKSQVISASLKIQQAGEALVLNSWDWSIIYRGAIVLKATDGKIQEHYLRDAMDALLEKKNPAISETPVEGCPIDMEMVSPQRKVSYVKKVAPILISQCLPCHNEGRDDTWTMRDYEMVESYSSLIREEVRTKRMPPWKGDDSLSSEEIRTLVRWVEQGAVQDEGPDPLKLEKAG